MGYIPAAAFAKFDRSKPHLNVGTIGKYRSSPSYLRLSSHRPHGLHIVSTFSLFSLPYQFIFNNNKIGHIDHGKTTLTAAITKYLAQKGMQINRRKMLLNL